MSKKKKGLPNQRYIGGITPYFDVLKIETIEINIYFYNQNKEEAKKNIDSSSKELTDFIDSLIQDTPTPSDEEVNVGIEKILKITHPEEQTKTIKTNKNNEKDISFDDRMHH